MNRKNFVVLGTGGTIAGRACLAGDNIGYKAGEVGVDQLLAGLPLPVGVTLSAEQLVQIDSKDMSNEVWRHLLRRLAHHLADAHVDGVLITHGTDTLEETAVFLQLALASSGLLRKPVVLTCAMRPATALVPDGPQNMLDAVAVLLTLSLSSSSPTTPCHQVMAVCAGTVHGAMDVQKQHPYRTDAFSSGESGPLGFVEESTVRWVRSFEFKWPSRHIQWPKFAIELIVSEANWPRVEIVLSHAGSDGHLVDLLVADAISGSAQAVHGLVVAATGNGTIHQSLETAIGRAMAAGLSVLRATRCAQGQIVAMPGMGLMDSEGLTPVKARVALLLKLLHQL